MVSRWRRGESAAMNLPDLHPSRGAVEPGFKSRRAEARVGAPWPEAEIIQSCAVVAGLRVGGARDAAVCAALARPAGVRAAGGVAARGGGGGGRGGAVGRGGRVGGGVG